ncbi:MAG: hypothetical protein M9936_25680 [Caldilinea sp.]|nr:hypothetical protein [Caldilinea sp.]MCB0148228.1 hypothetical protein [Caldilineaceae bacterium]MCB9120920.1 hypothetical protein [Caldilineaceae bacterium]MCO5213104.1 hypothetical protein [Caldilinea sp.]MCW5839760.1 hypothetical protein [Caldilinea sp.]
MTFAEVDRQYASLKEQWQSGMLTDEAFDEALKGMMIQDEQGRWWAKARDTGQWNYYDNASQAWVPATPPSAAPQPSAPPPAPAPMAGAQQAYTPAPAPQSYGAAAAYGSTQPELSSGLKVVFYILSFLVPIVGIVLFFVYRNKVNEQDKAAARLFLILGIVSFVISCMCSFVFPVMLSLGSY